MKRILTALLILPLLLVASLAVTAPEEDAARIFDEGRALYDEGKFQQALGKFESTLALKDSPNARLYLARTLHELDRPVEAYQQMVRTKQQSEAMDDAKYVHTRDIAAARLAIIEKEIGRVIVVPSDVGQPIQLSVAGREIPKEQIGKIVPVEPGKVAVVATKPDGDVIRKELQVAAGALVTVPLDLGTDSPPAPAPTTSTPADASPATPPTPEGPAPDDGEPGLGALTTTGIVLASVGVVGMGVFGVAGALALDKHSGISDECGGIACPEERYNDDIDEGQTLQLVANVGFGVGIGGLAVGTALIVIGSLTGDDDAPASDGVAVQAGPGGAFLGYTATF